jgi:dTDP-4-amino-4,6-dideoxygalactose transaminase
VTAVPHVPEGLVSAWAQYSIRSPKRDTVMNTLKAAGIPSVVYYPKPLHQQTAYASLRYPAGSLPVSERTSQEIFSLPMHPYLEQAEQDVVIRVVIGAMRK